MISFSVMELLKQCVEKINKIGLDLCSNVTMVSLKVKFVRFS